MNGSNFEDVEDRDGAYCVLELCPCLCLGAYPVRCPFLVERMAVQPYRGDAHGRAHLCALHAAKGEGRLAASHVRARHVQGQL